MLDKFKSSQPLFVSEINNSINNNKVVHAYLIETNGFNETNDLIKSFVKELFKIYTKDDSELLNISNLIDNGGLTDYIEIKPDGAQIKKEQILDLKEKFKMTSFDNRCRIYVIYDCDKLNSYAANSLLKFLEEPEGNIIAILVSDNISNVLETIKSRCQIYRLNNNNVLIYDIEMAKKMIDILENKGLEAITYFNALYGKEYPTRLDFINYFNDLLLIYESALRKKYDLNNNIDSDIIDLIINNNTKENIISKIDILFTTINNLNYNLSVVMMLDKFVIEFNGGL